MFSLHVPVEKQTRSFSVYLHCKYTFLSKPTEEETRQEGKILTLINARA